jgi:hypothetical protein
MVRLIGVNFPAPEYQLFSLKNNKMDGLLLQLTHQLRRFSQLRRIKKSYRVKVLRCCNISEGWRGGGFFCRQVALAGTMAAVAAPLTICSGERSSFIVKTCPISSQSSVNPHHSIAEISISKWIGTLFPSSQTTVGHVEDIRKIMGAITQITRH